jgi:hypothetical protein
VGQQTIRAAALHSKTRLSPNITHRFVSRPEVLSCVAARQRLDVQHKLALELG